MQSTNLVSVLLPLYNEPIAFAKEAIDSILKQTYQNLEIILLLDNPQNEELKKLITDYKGQDERVRIHVNEENRGLPATLNAGINLATGDYIARMDGDDISVSTRIEKQLNYLLEHPKIDLIGSNAYIINEDGEEIGEYRKLQTDFSQKVMLRKASTNMIHPTWFGKSSLFKQCKYRNFMHCEDYDFMARTYAMGANFYNLKEKLLYYRIQQKNSVSRKYAYEQYINTLRVRKQLNDYLAQKEKVYPPLPHLTYDTYDKQKYQSTVPLVNQLRESFLQRKIWDSISFCIKIIRKDSRPIISRIRALTISRLLLIGEWIKNEK